MRPELSAELDGSTFRRYYYLKEELVAFCRTEGLPTAGGKLELTERIARYLDTGERWEAGPGRRKAVPAEVIAPNTPIEADLVCSERHRAFFRAHLGERFTFTVPFQRWLRANAGKTYGDAIEAYRRLQEEKRRSKTAIDRQFEYNTYIRDFFADNGGRPLEEAIRCWKYKRSLPGHNRYERSDLAALGESG